MISKFCLCLLILFFSFQGNAQLESISLSTELLFSDITTKDKERGVQKYNTWKYHAGARASTTFKLWMNSLKLKTSLFYNERKALEFFIFEAGFLEDRERFPQVEHYFIFGEWPTSPQNKLFHNTSEEGMGYIHLPDFKYLHVDLIPVLSLGEKWKYQIGLGLFGGLLLNSRDVTFGREYFPLVPDLFDAGYLRGEIKYHRYDFGGLAYLGIQYPITEELTIGWNSRFNYSFVNLDGNFRERKIRDQSYNWIVLTGGVELTYRLARRSK